MTLVFATGNRAKLREAREILGAGVRIASPADLGLTDDIPETGDTLAANSRQKADYVRVHLGVDCFADDTGLEVDLLGGAPGVRSARYAGEGHDFQANMDKLLRELARREAEAPEAAARLGRRARFRTVVTLLLGGDVHIFEGAVEGRIGYEKKGAGGFGYDPLFIPDEIPTRCTAPENRPGGSLDKASGAGMAASHEESIRLVPNHRALTMAELTEEEKNAISHRGRALRAMAAFLRERAIPCPTSAGSTPDSRRGA